MINTVNTLRPRVISLFLIIVIIDCALLMTGCHHTKKGMDISTNGFISDSCYQAVLTIEPDNPQSGLVDRRDSAYMKAHASGLRQLALENLVDYCTAMKERASMSGKSGGVDSRAELMAVLSGIVPKGKTAFVYYNDRGAAVIGYQFCRLNLKKKIDVIINLQDENSIHSDQNAGGKQ